MSPDFLTGIVTSISCAFSTRSFLLQILKNYSRRHSILMLLSLSSVTNSSLFFWIFCSMHADKQVPPDGVVGSRNCRCHLFAACTVDVTVCSICQTVSVLISGLSRYPAQLTPYSTSTFDLHSLPYLLFCHVKTARFVLSRHCAGISLLEIALSAWMSASSFADDVKDVY